MNKNLISVITVCFNSEKTIENTFNSLLNQDMKNFEYIVIDGKSNDGTVEIIKKYEEKFQNNNIKFKWISETDTGIYDAMNKGIRMSSGNIIGILNSDDIYMSDTISTVYNVAIERPEYDIYHGLCRFVSHNDVTMIRGTSSDRLSSSMIEHPTCFVRREAYDSVGIFDTSYRYVADYDLMIRMKKSNKKFYLIEKILAQFDENGSGNSIKSRKELIGLQKRYSLLPKYKLIFKYLKTIINK